MKWFLSLVSTKTEYSVMQFSIRTWLLLWCEKKSKHYPWDTIVKKTHMWVWNLADIWQHWDGKGGGLYTDYRRDGLHHLPPRIWLVEVRQERVLSQIGGTETITVLGVHHHSCRSHRTGHDSTGKDSDLSSRFTPFPFSFSFSSFICFPKTFTAIYIAATASGSESF